MSGASGGAAEPALDLISFEEGVIDLGDERPDMSVLAQERVLAGPLLGDAIAAAAQPGTLTQHLQVQGAAIVGALDLSYRHLAVPITFVSCVFTGPVLMIEAETNLIAFVDCLFTGAAENHAWFVGDRLACRGSVIFRDVDAVNGGLLLLGAQIGGQLQLADVQFTGTDDRGNSVCGDNLRVGDGVFLNHGFASNGAVRFSRAKVESIFTADGARIGCDGDGFALRLSQLESEGGVSLGRDMRCDGGVDLRSSQVGWLDMSQSVVKAGPEAGYALLMSGALVDGDLELTGAHFLGSISLSDARVAGNLECEGLLIGNQSELFFDATQIEVRGSAEFSEMDCGGSVVARGARIGGDLTLSGARLGSLPGRNVSLTLDGANVGRACYLNRGFESVGGVSLVGLDVTGDLSLGSAHIAGAFDATAQHTNCSLAAANIVVGGALAMDEGFDLAGCIVLTRARVEGHFIFNGHVAGVDSEGSSVVGDRLVVAATAYVLENTVLAGSLRLPGARIGGQLNMRDARLGSKTSEPALIADRCIVTDRARISALVGRGGLSLGESHFQNGLSLSVVIPASADPGEICFIDARHTRVDGDLSVRLTDMRLGASLVEAIVRATSHKPATAGTYLRPVLPHALLDLESAEVGKGIDLWCRQVLHLNLSQARMGRLGLLGGTRPSLVSADNLVVGALSGRVFDNRSSVVGWLDHAHFSPSSWHGVATALEMGGRADDGRRVRYEAEKRQSRRRSTLGQLGALVMRGSIGYGYYPRRALACLAVAVIVGIGLAYVAADDFTVAATPTIAADLEVQRQGGAEAATVRHGLARNEFCRESWDVRCLQIVDFAVITVVPSPGFGSSAWSAPPGWVTYGFLLLRSVAWVLLALFIAGVTGVLRVRR